jgi:ADP-ribose pyrophosphatase YjhB (NUDIX family)
MVEPRHAAELARLLAAHAPADAREAGFVAEMRALLDRAPRCFARDHFEPGHFTASAFVLDHDGTALLLVLHAKLGLWLQPGGHLEATDEGIVAAARREVREEVGLGEVELARDGILDVDVHAIPAYGAAPPHRHFDVRFLFRAPRAALRAADDAADARWVPIAQVASERSDESVMRAVRRLRECAPRAP